jgi:hypothetical protein
MKLLRFVLCQLLILGCGKSYAQKAVFDFLPNSVSTLESGVGVWASTNLIELKQGSELSDLVAIYSNGGYESAYGNRIAFNSWYRPKNQWVDTKISFMTQLNKDFGLLWGVGTGENGGKYNISPSVKFGFIYRVPYDRGDSGVYLRLTSILGGRLKEKSCVADYGQIGGNREVNCRLAAGVDVPEDTLRNLMNQRPYNQNTISVVYKLFF